MKNAEASGFKLAFSDGIVSGAKVYLQRIVILFGVSVGTLGLIGLFSAALLSPLSLLAVVSLFILAFHLFRDDSIRQFVRRAGDKFNLKSANYWRTPSDDVGSRSIQADDNAPDLVTNDQAAILHDILAEFRSSNQRLSESFISSASAQQDRVQSHFEAISNSISKLLEAQAAVNSQIQETLLRQQSMAPDDQRKIMMDIAQISEKVSVSIDRQTEVIEGIREAVDRQTAKVLRFSVRESPTALSNPGYIGAERRPIVGHVVVGQDIKEGVPKGVIITGAGVPLAEAAAKKIELSKGGLLFRHYNPFDPSVAFVVTETKGARIVGGHVENIAAQPVEAEFVEDTEPKLEEKPGDVSP